MTDYYPPYPNLPMVSDGWLDGYGKGTTDSANTSASILNYMFDLFNEQSIVPIFVEYFHTVEGGYLIENTSGTCPYYILVPPVGNSSLFSYEGNFIRLSGETVADTVLLFQKFVEGWVGKIAE